MSDAATPSPCPTVRARTILQKVRYNGDEWFGIDYNMNLYRGCCHGCIYCDSRSECYRIDDFDRVSVKFDALAILRRELRSRRTRGIVGIGAMSDTYNPFERKLRVTRGALELVEEFGFGVSVDTKSTLVTRDADLLSAIGRQGGAIRRRSPSPRPTTSWRASSNRTRPRRASASRRSPSWRMPACSAACCSRRRCRG